MALEMKFLEAQGRVDEFSAVSPAQTGHLGLFLRSERNHFFWYDKDPKNAFFLNGGEGGGVPGAFLTSCRLCLCS